MVERKIFVEGTFGLTKEPHELRRSRFRGRHRVQVQLWLTAAAMNIKKAVRAGTRAGTRAACHLRPSPQSKVAARRPSENRTPRSPRLAPVQSFGNSPWRPERERPRGFHFVFRQ